MSGGGKLNKTATKRRAKSLGSISRPNVGSTNAPNRANPNNTEAAQPPVTPPLAVLGNRPLALNSSLTNVPNARTDNRAIVRRHSTAVLVTASQPVHTEGVVEATRINDVQDVQDREKARLGAAEEGPSRKTVADGLLPKAISLRTESVSPNAEGIIKVAEFEKIIEPFSTVFFHGKPDKQNALRNELITHLTGYHKEIANIKQTLKIQNDARVNKGKVLKILNSELSETEREIAVTKKSKDDILSEITKNLNLDFTENTERAKAAEVLKNLNNELKAKEDKLAGLINQKTQLETNIKSGEDFINNSLENERNSIPNQLKDLTDYIGRISAAAIALNNTFIIKSDTLKKLTDGLSEANILKDLRDAQMEASGGIPFEQQLVKVPRIKNKESANIVYVVETNEALGNPNNHVGYAKIATTKGEPKNVNTDNLAIPSLNNILTEHPNMIARSVLSYEVDKLLGIGVTSYETFTRNIDGRLMGISGQVSGQQCEIISADKKNIPNPEILAETFKNAKTQKMLSDLQIMDAITGQTDRHMGNIFIDPASGTVSSIDQDQAHPSDNDFLRPAQDNKKFISGTNQLGGQFKKEGNKLIYMQKLIDAGTAEKILKITPEQLRLTLKKQVGDESLPDKSVEAEIERFNAVKARIIELKNQKPSGLIRTWNDSTFKQLVEGRNGIAREQEYDESGAVYIQPRFNNYVAAGAYMVAGKVAKNDFNMD